MVTRRIRTKVCGITSPEDALAAAEAGVDAIGLNFYPKSPRYITLDQAAKILAVLPPFIEPIGLFVNEAESQIESVAQRLSIRTVQLHGDRLTPVRWTHLRWIPAFSLRPADDLRRIEDFVDRCMFAPAAVLVDAHVSGSYGGTGQVAPWSELAGWTPPVPLVLAGGLTPENVADAIRAVQPFAVDVASGVESAPGRKELAKMIRFVAAAASTFTSATQQS